jgi:hypothetical protein
MADRTLINVAGAADIDRSPSTDYTRRLLSAMPLLLAKALRV